MITQIKYEDVNPPLSGDDWNISGPYKVEFIYKDVWTNIPPEHWARKFANYSETDQNGIYINSDYPNELVRVIGFKPEYAIYIFTKK